MNAWTRRPLARFGAAFIFLSICLNFNYPGRPLLSWQLLLPSVDVWLLMAGLGLAGLWGRRIALWTVPLVWLLFLVLRLIRFGDTAVPMYLNRPFNLYIDSGYLFGLYDLLRTSSSQRDFLVMTALTAALGLGAIAATWCAWRSAARALATNRVRRLFWGGSALFLGAVLIGWRPPLKAPVLQRLGEEIRLIGHQAQQRRAFAAHLDDAVRTRQGNGTTLTGLGGADVLLFMIESYGRIVFSAPHYRPAMLATMDRFAGVLEEQGFQAASSYLDSPTYGGASWLAHGTLESGVRVRDELEDTALLRSAVVPLAAYFGANGYRTVSVMPGTRFAFPQGAWFGYEQVYYAWHFDYRGRTFGWAPMPDQFVLDRVRRREFTPSRPPLFIRSVLISTHAAFSIQPPYIENWDLIGDGALYHERQPVFFPITWPNLGNAGEAYLRSLEYEFTVLGDFLAEHIDREALIIIMGDHQPNVQLTGPGEPWSVPVHVISRSARLLEPFRRRGYSPGLVPSQPPPHAGMETFMPAFLDDFR